MRNNNNQPPMRGPVQSKWEKHKDGGYVSSHRTIYYNKQVVPEWWAQKSPFEKKWILFFFNQRTGTYSVITGLKPFDTLKDLKYYVDVEVKEFEEGY